MPCPQKCSGKQQGLFVSAAVEGTSGSAACSRGFQMLPVFTDSGVSCSFQRGCSWMGNGKSGTSASSPCSWPVGPTPCPWRENLICVWLWLWEHFVLSLVGTNGRSSWFTCTCSWGPGSLSEGAFKWKPFTCRRLKFSVRPVVR